MTKLGQHFLISKKVIRAIISAAELSPSDVVLEIGPGRGALTNELLANAEKVIAIEKDQKLYDILKNKHGANKKLELINSDIRSFNPITYNLKPKTYKLVANIPYYLTGAILRTFLESPCPPSKMVFLVQKEVADRIMARDGKESILSISVKSFGIPKYIQKVPAKHFLPPPKVDSAIISIDTYDDRNDRGNDRGLASIMNLVRRGFAHKRKMLSKNLGIDPSILAECGISPHARAENLSTDNWRCLSAILNTKAKEKKA